jgi:hypothetical protein
VIRTVAAGAACVLVAATAACSSSGGDPDAGGSHGADVSNAVCTKDAATKKVDLPAGFPSGFPLPSGTIVYKVDERGADEGIVVTGVTSTPFKTVLKSLQSELPAKGFRADNGEVEPHDAESDWASSAFEGRWAIREIPQCDGDTLVNVVARATS